MTASLLGWLLAAAALAFALRLRRRLELVARADHELRGPIGALGLGLDLLARRSSAEADVVRRASALQGELDRMRLGLADLTAARGGRRAAVRARPVALETIVSRTADAWAPVAARAGGDVRVDWGAGPAVVSGDPRGLVRVVSNLVANAVEHGGGEVRLVARPGPLGVRVEVRDSGPGFAGPGRRPARRGRGRGLALAATAAAEAGGSLSLRSAGPGAAVAVDLPTIGRSAAGEDPSLPPAA